MIPAMTLQLLHRVSCLVPWEPSISNHWAVPTTISCSISSIGILFLFSIVAACWGGQRERKWDLATSLLPNFRCSALRSTCVDTIGENTGINRWRTESWSTDICSEARNRTVKAPSGQNLDSWYGAVPEPSEKIQRNGPDGNGTTEQASVSRYNRRKTSEWTLGESQDRKACFSI